jgi:protein gp37
MNLSGIGWVNVGWESSHKARPKDPEWVLDIQEECHVERVAFFFNQWGSKNKKKAGRELNGQTYDEMPDVKLERYICPK